MMGSAMVLITEAEAPSFGEPSFLSGAVPVVRRAELMLVTKTLASSRIEKRDFAIGCLGAFRTSLVRIRALGTRGRLLAAVLKDAACHA